MPGTGPRMRHSGGTNVVFVDGHIEKVPDAKFVDRTAWSPMLNYPFYNGQY